jgi:phage gp29-like protein
MDNADVERILAPEIKRMRSEGMTVPQIADAITKEVVKQLKSECATLRAERDALKAEAERKSIAGAQLFHDMQAELERLRAEVSENERAYLSLQDKLDAARVATMNEQDAALGMAAQLRELREAAQAFHAWVYKSWGKHEPVERFGAVLAKGGA